jgi:hypothetical protein
MHIFGVILDIDITSFKSADKFICGVQDYLQNL